MLTDGGTIELVECPLDDLISVCGNGCHVFKMDVKIVGQVCALGENTVFSVERGRVGGRNDAVDELCGG